MALHCHLITDLMHQSPFEDGNWLRPDLHLHTNHFKDNKTANSLHTNNFDNCVMVIRLCYFT